MLFTGKRDRKLLEMARIEEDANRLIAECGGAAALRAQVRASIAYPREFVPSGGERLHWLSVAAIIDQRLNADESGKPQPCR